MFWREAIVVAVVVWCCGVVGVVAAPADSSNLPAEHRTKYKPTTSTPHPIEDIVDAVLKSETVSAMDAAAATLTSVVGKAIDDLGDFVVEGVKDLPSTIQEVTRRVSQAVNEGGERVVIVVKGLRQGIFNDTNVVGNTAVNTVDRVMTAANTSQTLASLQELQKRVVMSFTRIFGSLFVNLDKIDTAMAQSIRHISNGGASDPYSDSNPDHYPTTQDNEVKVLA